MIQLEIQYTDHRPGIFVRVEDANNFQQYLDGQFVKLTADEVRAKLSDWLSGYSRFTLFLEDLVVVSPAPLEVAAFDTVNATLARATWTSEQLSTVVRMGFLGDDSNDADYAIAEPLFKDWPSECRIIP